MKRDSVELERVWNRYSHQSVARERVCGGAACGRTTLDAAGDGWRWRWTPRIGEPGRATEIRCPKCFERVVVAEQVARRGSADGCPRCGRALAHDTVGEDVERVTCDVCAWHAEGDRIPARLRDGARRVLGVALASLLALVVAVTPVNAQNPARRWLEIPDVIVTTTAAQIFPADATRRSATCYNPDSTITVRVGSSTITTARGLAIPPKTSVTVVNATYAIFAITESSTATISCVADYF